MYRYIDNSLSNKRGHLHNRTENHSRGYIVIAAALGHHIILMLCKINNTVPKMCF